MTDTETKSFLLLGASLAVLAYVVMRMTDGWQVVPAGAAELWRTWIGALALAVVLELAVGGLMAWRRRTQPAIRDERDAANEARAALLGRGAVLVGVNVVIWQVLVEETIAGPSMRGWDFLEAPVLVFSLLLVLLIGQIVQRAATLVLGRL